MWTQPHSNPAVVLHIFLKISLAWENKLIMKQVCKSRVPAEWDFHMQMLLRRTLVEAERQCESAPDVVALRDFLAATEQGLKIEPCSCKAAVIKHTCEFHTLQFHCSLLLWHQQNIMLWGLMLPNHTALQRAAGTACATHTMTPTLTPQPCLWSHTGSGGAHRPRRFLAT